MSLLGGPEARDERLNVALVLGGSIDSVSGLILSVFHRKLSLNTKWLNIRVNAVNQVTV